MGNQKGFATIIAAPAYIDILVLAVASSLPSHTSLNVASWPVRFMLIHVLLHAFESVADPSRPWLPARSGGDAEAAGLASQRARRPQAERQVDADSGRLPGRDGERGVRHGFR